MKSLTKITKQSLISLTVESLINGSIHEQYLSHKKTSPHLSDEDLIDTIISPILNKHLALFIQTLDKPNFKVEEYSDPEYENLPTNEDETKNLCIKMRLTIQVKLDIEPAIELNF